MNQRLIVVSITEMAIMLSLRQISVEDLDTALFALYFQRDVMLGANTSIMQGRITAAVGNRSGSTPSPEFLQVQDIVRRAEAQGRLVWESGEISMFDQIDTLLKKHGHDPLFSNGHHWMYQYNQVLQQTETRSDVKVLWRRSRQE